MLTNFSQMSLMPRVREGKPDLNYLDFVIDGNHLSDIDEIGEMDVVSCFGDASIALANESWLALTLQHRSVETALLYVCPLCADIACGAVQVGVSRTEYEFVWSSFSYVNGYDDPKPLLVGPFKFEAQAYLQALRDVPHLLESQARK